MYFLTVGSDASTGMVHYSGSVVSLDVVFAN